MPVIILGGIFGGIFTPTEAAAVSVVYAYIVGTFIYKEIKWKNLFDATMSSCISTSNYSTPTRNIKCFWMDYCRIAVTGGDYRFFFKYY